MESLMPVCNLLKIVVSTAGQLALAFTLILLASSVRSAFAGPEFRQVQEQDKVLVAKKKKQQPAPEPKSEPFDLKGIKLGFTVDQFHAASPFTTAAIVPDTGNTGHIEFSKMQLAEATKSNGAPFTVATIEPNFLWFNFVKRDNQWLLYKIRVEFLTEQSDTVLTGLTEKYGKPTSIERIAKRNAAGTEFQSRDAVWDNELSQIYFREIAGQVGKGDLTFVHKELENAGLEPNKSGAGKDL